MISDNAALHKLPNSYKIKPVKHDVDILCNAKVTVKTWI